MLHTDKVQLTVGERVYYPNATIDLSFCPGAIVK